MNCMFLKKVIVSLSGGRTSGALVELFGPNADYVFVNTGFEHPKTYEFIRNIAEHYGINVTCLRPLVNPKLGISNTYTLQDVSEINMDTQIMVDHVTKYGCFTVSNPMCSERMKTVVMEAYIKDHYAGVDYTHVLGFRYDEQRRILGQQGAKIVKALGYDVEETYKLKQEWCAKLKELGIQGMTQYLNSLFLTDMSKSVKSLVTKLGTLNKFNLTYMCEYTDMDKQDVLNFWSEMPFDLEIDEHEGNCVFCVKKDRKKVALAARDNPELVPLWEQIVAARRKMPAYDGDRQYRYPKRYKTLSEVIDEFSMMSTEDLREFVYKSRNKDVDGCTESCEAFG